MKRVVVAILYGLGILWLSRLLNRRRLVILTYHGVLPSEAGPADARSRNVVTEDEFRRQVRYLSRAYRCLPLAEAVELLRRGERLPLYPACVTFDDGFRNNFVHAFPILREYGVPATIFLATGHIGTRIRLLWTEKAEFLIMRTPKTRLVLEADGIRWELSLGDPQARARAARRTVGALKAMSSEQRERLLRALEAAAGVSDGDAEREPGRYAFLDWPEVREMANHGIEFGSHTVSHAILATLGAEARLAEVVESKHEIERRLGRPCRLFSYPNGTAGDFADVDKANLREAGYRGAVTQIAGLNDGTTDPFELRRVNIGRGHSGLLFIAQVSGLWPLVSGGIGRLRRLLRTRAAREGAAGAARPEVARPGPARPGSSRAVRAGVGAGRR